MTSRLGHLAPLEGGGCNPTSHLGLHGKLVEQVGQDGQDCMVILPPNQDDQIAQQNDQVDKIAREPE